MTKGSLLLVDDDRHILASMSGWLREQGYAVDEADSLAKAKSAVDKQSYELVIADIRLEDGDGFDLLAHCRETQPSTSVILMTGYAVRWIQQSRPFGPALSIS